MADIFYPYARAEARRMGETQMHEDSFRLNVSCARAIEQAIQDHFNEADETLDADCAQSVLEQFGFKRVNFVLTNSLKELQKSNSNHLVCDETYQWGKRTYVPSDGKYNRYYSVDTAAPLLEAFIGQARTAYQKLGLFEVRHCSTELDYTGKVLILRPAVLREECWFPQNQLWYGECGFGCSPTARGRAVYATCLGDGEKTRWDRIDFMGVLDERYLPDWAMERLAELRGTTQEQTDSPAQGGMEMG